MRKVAFCSLMIAALVFFLVPLGKNQTVPQGFAYKDPTLTVDERIKDLVSRMTLEEKIAQLQCQTSDVTDDLVKGGIGGLGPTLRDLGPGGAAAKANRLQKVALEQTRLGIPLIIHDEALHGLLGKASTSFPQAIGLASTWDPELLEQIATVIGKQTRSRGIRQVLSPVINIARDVRWGRVEETYGEDPYLTSRMGVAFCKAIEEAGVVTTPKHFVANVGDGGRDSNAVHFSERLLREVYFPAFKACFQEGHARSVMAAYNSLDGVPCAGNHWLLTDILRKEWGFQGYVVSDYGAVDGIRTEHRTAATPEQTAQQALEAGLDVELPDVSNYGKPLLEAVRAGLVPEATVDTAVSRVLRAKFQLRLFENPYVDAAEAERTNDTSEDRALALRAAREAIVLLKNENHLLPLKKNIRSVAVIGPNADAVQLGGYSGFGMKVVTVLEGIKKKVSAATRVSYLKGCELGFAPLPPIPAANLYPPNARPGEHGLRGEYFTNMTLSGEPALVRIDPQINFDWNSESPDPRIPRVNFSVRWTGVLVPKVTGAWVLSTTTDDGVRLYVDGKLRVDSWVDRGPTPDYIEMKLEAGRRYNLRIEYYQHSGGAVASLGWSVKPSLNAEIAKAAAAAKSSDAVIFVAGINEGEGRDRAYLDLPGPQEDFIKALAATRVPTVVVLIDGSAVTMNNWTDGVSAIVEAWYPGEEGGTAVADVLFGDYNPGGKLPITFPQTVGQTPLYSNPKPSGRGYDYVSVSGKPLFPFGYGLSYTQFAYSNLQIIPEKSTPTGNVEVRVDVENQGTRQGDEVVQLYLHAQITGLARPLKELKAFKRISLAAGEKKPVTFLLTPEQLAVLNLEMQSVVEPGTFEVMLGSSSEDIRARGRFEIPSR